MIFYDYGEKGEMLIIFRESEDSNKRLYVESF